MLQFLPDEGGKPEQKRISRRRNIIVLSLILIMLVFPAYSAGNSVYYTYFECPIVTTAELRSVLSEKVTFQKADDTPVPSCRFQVGGQRTLTIERWNWSSTSVTIGKFDKDFQGIGDGNTFDTTCLLNSVNKGDCAIFSMQKGQYSFHVAFRGQKQTSLTDYQKVATYLAHSS
jgi:hypothetical protein